MLDIGFQGDAPAIFGQVRPGLQVFCCSATRSANVQQLARGLAQGSLTCFPVSAKAEGEGRHQARQSILEELVVVDNTCQWEQQVTWMQ